MKLLFCLITLIVFSLENTYKEDDSLKFWDFSRLSYCSLENILSINCGPLCENYKQDLVGISVISSNVSNTLAFTAFSQKENSLILVFRGTFNFKNWIQDLDALKQDYPLCENCKIHEGFYSAYQSLELNILQELKKLQENYNNRNIIIIGHSLGAALATLAVGELKNLYKIKKYYSFASPRVGTVEYSQWWNKIEIDYKFRVTNNKDIVVHLPMQSFGFDHIDEEVWYFESNTIKYKNCPNHEDDNCANSVHWLSVADHTNYLLRETTEENANYKFTTCRGSALLQEEYIDEEKFESRIKEIQEQYLEEQERKHLIKEEM